MESRDPLRVPRNDPEVRTSRITRTRARIKTINALNHDTRQVVLELVPGSPPISARAGQFVVIDIPDIGVTRPFSLGRAPLCEEAGQFTLLIRLVQDGAFSRWLENGAAVGVEVSVAGPMGSFMRDESDNDIVCIAGGSGLSAVFALLEEAAFERVPRNGHLFYGARSESDLILIPEIETLAKSWSERYSLSFVAALSDAPEDDSWGGERGYISDVARRTLAGQASFDPLKVSVFLCGPPPMITAAEEAMAALGVPDSAIFRDVFEDASSPAPAIDNQRCVLCDECLLVKPVEDCIVEANIVPEAANEQRFAPIEPGNTAGLYYNALVIDETRCIRCYACVGVCPHDAISASNERVPQVLRQI